MSEMTATGADEGADVPDPAGEGDVRSSTTRGSRGKSGKRVSKKRQKLLTYTDVDEVEGTRLEKPSRKKRTSPKSRTCTFSTTSNFEEGKPRKRVSKAALLGDEDYDDENEKPNDKEDNYEKAVILFFDEGDDGGSDSVSDGCGVTLCLATVILATCLQYVSLGWQIYEAVRSKMEANAHASASQHLSDHKAAPEVAAMIKNFSEASTYKTTLGMIIVASSVLGIFFCTTMTGCGCFCSCKNWVRPFEGFFGIIFTWVAIGVNLVLIAVAWVRMSSWDAAVKKKAEKTGETNVEGEAITGTILIAGSSGLCIVGLLAGFLLKCCCRSEKKQKLGDYGSTSTSSQDK